MISRITYCLGWIMCNLYLRLYHGYRVYGRRHVPKDRGVVIASNHASYLDPIIIGSAIPRRIWYLARTTLFEHSRFFSWLLTTLNAVPISRERLELKTMRAVQELCRNGRSVVIFPEGTRSPDGELRRGLAGIGLMAEKIGVDILPVYVDSFHAFDRHSKWPRPVPVKVMFGAPMPLARWQHISDARARYQAIADGIMETIAALKQELQTRDSVTSPPGTGLRNAQ